MVIFQYQPYGCEDLTQYPDIIYIYTYHPINENHRNWYSEINPPISKSFPTVTSPQGDGL